MFVARSTRINARTGTTGGTQQSGLTALLGPKRKRKEDTVGFYCWVPFMLRPCVAGLVGLFVLLGGTGMAIVGYYAQSLATERVSNETYVDNNKKYHLNNLTYLGPVIMGCGCFMIVVAFVVVCEYRDKQIRLKIEDNKRKKMERKDKKRDFYDSVVDRLKTSKLYIPKVGNKKAAVNGMNGDVLTSEKDGLVKTSKQTGKHITFPCISAHDKSTTDSEKTFEHISKALMSIPMDIFTLEMDSLKGTASLLPVRADPVAQIEQYKSSDRRTLPLKKCPSASCIPDLVKVDESRLEEVFPERRQWLYRSKTDINLKAYKMPLNTNSQESQVLPSANKMTGNDAIIVNEVKPQRPTHAVIDEMEFRGAALGVMGTTRSTVEDTQSDISDCSRTSDKNPANVVAQDSIINQQCDSTGDTSHTQNIKLPNFGSNTLINASNSEDISQENSSSRPNIIFHQAAVHSDENGYDVTGVRRMRENSTLDDIRKPTDVEAVAMSSSVARGNAIAMDTFRRSFSEKSQSVRGRNARAAFAVEKQSAVVDSFEGTAQAVNTSTDDEVTLLNVAV